MLRKLARGLRGLASSSSNRLSSCPAVSAAGGLPPAAPCPPPLWCLQHSHGLRSGVEVPVVSNKLDRALRSLRQTLLTEGITARWKERAHYKKPSEQRVLDQKETARRLAKRDFRRQMAFVMKLKSRGY